ncbi:ankyrin repeat domain-containing protein 12 isoform X3 [Agrilus planipennis]|uniref:Ankyrin repeat domain-containing protein 12 isoform X3 n=1 Tax=Agrilus planipennis TaxID=224129 RepID=A0A7F5RHP9_AGRPL|nr:ankyrin repeat domain-containing protein 12 isoform X3 [Agrilus planipennis]
MPSSIKPKGSAGNSRVPPVTPMSERQQMALLMQMTSQSNDSGSRSPSSSSSSRMKDRNEKGETPLHLAAIKGDVEQVCKLLAHRADPNIKDFAGWTPLHEACSRGWYEVALRLIQARADVNVKGFQDDTPLHDAASNGHLKLVKLLVERGADILAKNYYGKTPLDVAAAGVAPIMLNPSLPISESSTSSRPPARSRDDKKVIDSSKQQQKNPMPSSEETMDTSSTSNKGTSGTTSSASSGVAAAPASSSEDVYEFKSVKESSDSASSPDVKNSEAASSPNDVNDAVDPLGGLAPPATGATASDESSKRNYSEVSDTGEDGSCNDEESRRKKRKEEGGAKESKSGPAIQRNVGQGKGGVASTKQGTGGGTGNTPSSKASGTASASKTAVAANSDRKTPPCTSPKPASASDAETDDGKTDLKVPPLKIVIPQSSANEQETGSSRNGKSNSQRSHQALPYVVATSNSGGSSEGAEKDAVGGGSTTSTDSAVVKNEDKKESVSGNDEQANPTNETDSTATTSNTNLSTPSAPVDLHPRKRKMKPNKDVPTTTPANDPVETPAVSEIHPHEQPITNCYQLFLNIRKQIEKRRKSLFPVQPKPPQGFKDYLMNRCTYVLAGTTPTTPNISYPSSLPSQMKDLFTEQEKERYRLRMQHVIEKEKLVLSVEQEILRVHGRAARALANQSLPFSVCTILRDEEIYNLITPEQEEKDRNARSRYNGRLFLSWLQDVDDKWEKIKEHMLLRHHNEAESLHAVQKMDWEWKMKELSLCDAKSTPTIDDHHVPIVHVSDDFDLLPA